MNADTCIDGWRIYGAMRDSQMDAKQKVMDGWKEHMLLKKDLLIGASCFDSWKKLQHNLVCVTIGLY